MVIIVFIVVVHVRQIAAQNVSAMTIAYLLVEIVQLLNCHLTLKRSLSGDGDSDASRMVHDAIVARNSHTRMTCAYTCQLPNVIRAKLHRISMDQVQVCQKSFAHFFGVCVSFFSFFRRFCWITVLSTIPHEHDVCKIPLHEFQVRHMIAGVIEVVVEM